MAEIKIKYFDSFEEHKLKKIEKGDWIDLRINGVKVITSRGKEIKFSGDVYNIQPNAVVCISLGIAMQLPKGYEAYILPRSSLFLKHGLLLTNSMGLIDNSYNGDEDEWKGVFYSTRNTTLQKGERILQFRIMKNMPAVEFKEMEQLGISSRGGFGSTDK